MTANNVLNLKNRLKQEILILDGAMGTMVQRYKLGKADFHAQRFKDYAVDLEGNNDILCLTKPEVIREIHLAYLEAGSDIIETNTFNANTISQADYKLESICTELNIRAATIAREAVDLYIKNNPTRKCYVAGALGPTSKSASIATDVNNPAFRPITFDELEECYYQQATALIKGGVDILLAETTFDTLNLKAAIYAIKRSFKDLKTELPLMLSVTISDASGRTLSGQTIEAFWNSVAHAKPISVGLNCSLGATELRPYLLELAEIAPCYISCYPNAGLPNPLSDTGFDETPEITASHALEFAQSKLVNIIGGCCGTTPDHIRAIAECVKPLSPRIPKQESHSLKLSGLEPLTLFSDKKNPFIVIGERTNVTGSAKFAKLVKSENFTEAAYVAEQQIDNGANIIDINFDEGLIDGEKTMSYFINLIGADPNISKVPIMIDSSKWSVILSGLKSTQGKCIVNSISLKEGEEVFLSHAREIQKFGAAVVVMAFDEQGQAATQEDKVRICVRAYKLLTEEIDFKPEDIIFDANILTVGTGIEEHNNYALNFINSLSKIKSLCPGAFTSGGISNVSFSFRGNNLIREAMHTIFLYHALNNGLDMGIINAGMLEIYSDIDQNLKDAIENVLLNKSSTATEELLELSQKISSKGKSLDSNDKDKWRDLEIDKRVEHALVNGFDKFIIDDCKILLDKYKDPLLVIEQPLMNGMKVVGHLFGEGKMFLPQVVKTARVMKKAVSYLEPLMSAGQSAQNESSKAGNFLIATVKGDVHDIGKNIVGVILKCNNYNVIDLGVMVKMDVILKTAKENNVDFIGLSGLITPSLDEMANVAKEMQRQQFTVPLLVGGATTSKAHTAIKIAPNYDNCVMHVKDASLVAEVCSKLLNKENSQKFISDNIQEQKEIVERFNDKSTFDFFSIEDARVKSPEWSAAKLESSSWVQPTNFDLQVNKNIDIKTILPFIDWSPFFWTWELRCPYPKILTHKKWGTQATELFNDAKKMLNIIVKDKIFKPASVTQIWRASGNGDDVNIYSDEDCKNKLATFHFLRQQRKKEDDSELYKCLADFIAPQASGFQDHMGGFAVSSGQEVDDYADFYEKKGDDYSSIMVKALGDRVAEALAELTHANMRKQWGIADKKNMQAEDYYKENYSGIRPAAGYPACPDHTEKQTLWSVLEVQKNIDLGLTESFAMNPGSAVSGLYFAHPDAVYFRVGRISSDQVEDYAKRKNVSVDYVNKWLAANI